MVSCVWKLLVEITSLYLLRVIVGKKSIWEIFVNSVDTLHISVFYTICSI